MIKKIVKYIKEIAKNHAVITAFIIAVLVIVMRRPDILLNAQFWAEDGVIWFMQMQDQGLQSLLSPQNGYYQTISRLAAAMSTVFSLAYAPLIMNIFFVVIRALPVAFLWSGRLDHMVPDWRAKIIVSIFYLGIPNNQEVHGNVTNAHWYLAFYAILVILSTSSKKLCARIHDVIIISVAAVSGPFSVVSAPLVFLWWMMKRSIWYSWHTVLIILLSVGALIQVVTIFLDAVGTRSDAEIGFSLFTLMQIVSIKIVGTSFLGGGDAQQLIAYPYIVMGLAILFIVVMAHTFMRAPIYLKIIIAYTTLFVAAALLSPQISTVAPEGQWKLMLIAPIVGSRYFVIPIFVWMLMLLWQYTYHKRNWLKVFFAMLILMSFYGMAVDFFIEPLKDLKWKQSVHTCYEKNIDACVVPINPEPWFVRINLR